MPAAPPRQPVPIFPLGLFVAGTDCLVVGAGKAASQKVGSLLAAAARVHVVALAAGPDFAPWLKHPEVRFEARAFVPADVPGKRLVLAATGDPAVNRQVLACCRAARVLCGAVDYAWQDGDFLNVATARCGSLVLALSTGGQASRRAKLVKNTLRRQLPALATVDCLTWAVPRGGDALAGLGNLLAQLAGLHEFALLETDTHRWLLALASRDPGLDTAIGRMLAPPAPAPGPGPQRGRAAFAGALALSAAQRQAALAQAQAQGWAGELLAAWFAALAANPQDDACKEAYARLLHGL